MRIYWADNIVTRMAKENGSKSQEVESQYAGFFVCNTHGETNATKIQMSLINQWKITPFWAEFSEFGGLCSI